METFTIDGYYNDGRIVLSQRPEGIRRARVRVVFLAEDPEEARTESLCKARTRALARMEAGINFGGETFRREEVYEERIETSSRREPRE